MLPPEETITVFDRMACSDMDLQRKYRIADWIWLLYGRYDHIALRLSRWNADYVSFHRDDARLFALLMLKAIADERPEWLSDAELAQARDADLTTVQRPISLWDRIVLFGLRPEKKYLLGDVRVVFGCGSGALEMMLTDLLATEVRNHYFGYRTVEMLARTILALIDNRAHEVAPAAIPPASN